MESNRGNAGTFLSTHKVARKNRDLISGKTSTIVRLKFLNLKFLILIVNLF